MLDIHIYVRLIFIFCKSAAECISFLIEGYPFKRHKFLRDLYIDQAVSVMCY